MNGLPMHLVCGLDLPQNTQNAINYKLPEWPPAPDFPIVTDSEGGIVSRYGDSRWDLSPWTKKAQWANFADGPQRKNAARLSKENADTLRALSAWWLYGPQPVRSAEALLRRIRLLKPLLALCSRENLPAALLSCTPRVANKFFEQEVPSSFVEPLLFLLHSIYEQRDLIGFYLLDREGLRRLEATLPRHIAKQTPYIPPRIWNYQIRRLRAFLDDYIDHRERIEACFAYCLDAYEANAGSFRAIYDHGLANDALPFSRKQSKRRDGDASDRTFYGTFGSVLEQFGIRAFVERWLASAAPADRGGPRVMSFASLLTLANCVGVAYLTNFSLMRIDECWSLHRDCHVVEQDPMFGEIHTLRSSTTKLFKDDDARWITGPSAKVAVDVLGSVASMRLGARARYKVYPEGSPDVRFLVQPSYEPWTRIPRNAGVRHSYPSYQQVSDYFPCLFDKDELRITPEDLSAARLVTPSLSSDFTVGKVWPLAWHQLRRTGAVNMQASGLVSEASIQYQLKHVTRAMTLYYGQGYSTVALKPEARAVYLRTMYEVLGHEVSHLFSEQYVSPYGQARKLDILNLVTNKDAKSLAAAARAGSISWRETHLGGCTFAGPCEYGGIDNIARCGGGDGKAPCADALFDKAKEAQMEALGRVIALRLVDAREGSPYRESLQAQAVAVRNALNVIRS